MKKLLLILTLLISAFARAQQLPPADQSRENRVLRNRATQAISYFLPPKGIRPSFPAYVPDSLKCGALYNVVGPGNDPAYPPGYYRYDCATITWLPVGGSSGGSYSNGPGVNLINAVFSLDTAYSRSLAQPQLANLSTQIAGKQVSGTYLTPTSTNTVSNKSMSGSANTFSNIPNSALVNSSISGTPLGGFLPAHAPGYGLIGNQYNGSSLQTLIADTTTLKSKAGFLIDYNNLSSRISGKQAAGSYAPSTTSSSILKGNGSGGFSNAIGNTDYQLPFTVTNTGNGASSFNGLVLNIPVPSGSTYNNGYAINLNGSTFSADTTVLKSKAGFLIDYNNLSTQIAGKQVAGTYLTPTSTNTVSNKSISGSANTLSNIPNSALINNTISGTALGGSLPNHTPGYGLNGSPYNGSAALPITADTTVLKSKAGFLIDYNNLSTQIAGKQVAGTYLTPTSTNTLTNKSISGSANTLSNIPNSALVNAAISGVALGGSLANQTPGYGLNGLPYNGSAPQPITADTTVLKSKAGFLTDYNNLSTRINAKQAAGSYELTTNKVTTLDNSTSNYPTTSAVTAALAGKLSNLTVTNTGSNTAATFTGGVLNIPLATVEQSLADATVKNYAANVAANGGIISNAQLSAVKYLLDGLSGLGILSNVVYLQPTLGLNKAAALTNLIYTGTNKYMTQSDGDANNYDVLLGLSKLANQPIQMNFDFAGYNIANFTSVFCFSKNTNGAYAVGTTQGNAGIYKSNDVNGNPLFNANGKDFLNLAYDRLTNFTAINIIAQDGSGVRWYRDGTLNTSITNSGTGNFPTGNWQINSDNNSLNMFFNKQLNVFEVQYLNVLLQNYFTLIGRSYSAKSKLELFTYQGDSITDSQDGSGSRYSPVFEQMVSTALGNITADNSTIANVAEGGKPASTMLTQAQADIRGLNSTNFIATNKPIFYIQAGTNDLIGFNSPVTVADSVYKKSIVPLLKLETAAGYHVIVETLHPTKTGTDAGSVNYNSATTGAQRLNYLIKSDPNNYNGVNANGVSLFDEIPEAQDAASTTYFYDGLHPKAALALLRASVVAKVIKLVKAKQYMPLADYTNNTPQFKSASFTVVRDYSNYQLSGAISVTLPSAQQGYNMLVSLTNTDGTAKTIIGTVDGVTNPVYSSAGKVVSIRSNGVSWITIDNTNVITSNTSQSGLTGDKTFTGGSTWTIPYIFGTEIQASSLISTGGSVSANKYLYSKYLSLPVATNEPVLYSESDNTVRLYTTPTNGVVGYGGNGLRIKNSSTAGVAAQQNKTTDLIFPVTAARQVTFQDRDLTIAGLDDFGKTIRLTGSGTGSATTITINHGLSGVTATSAIAATANTAAAAGFLYATVTATQVSFVYSTAPASGTNNLIYSVTIK